MFNGFAPVVKLHRPGQNSLQFFQLGLRHLFPDVIFLALAAPDGKAFSVIVPGDGIDERIRHTVDLAGQVILFLPGHRRVAAAFQTDVGYIFCR